MVSNCSELNVFCCCCLSWIKQNWLLCPSNFKNRIECFVVAVGTICLRTSGCHVRNPECMYIHQIWIFRDHAETIAVWIAVCIYNIYSFQHSYKSLRQYGLNERPPNFTNHYMISHTITWSHMHFCLWVHMCKNKKGFPQGQSGENK